MHGIQSTHGQSAEEKAAPRVAGNRITSGDATRPAGDRQKPEHKQRIAGAWSNAARLFFALWYLLGSLSHVWYGITNNHIYEILGRTSIFEVSRHLWASVVMPHITFFALLLAASEMTTGILILSQDRFARIGLAASIIFNLFLVQLGLGFTEVPWSGRDFLLNRLSCSLFAILQLPLFWVSFDLSFSGFIRTRLCSRSSPTRTTDFSRSGG